MSKSNASQRSESADQPSESQTPWDLVIRGGNVIDGAGGPAVVCDVAIRAGRIAQVGQVEGQSREEIEDRTFKLDFDTTSEYGRYVKSLWEAPWRAHYAALGSSIGSSSCLFPGHSEAPSVEPSTYKSGQTN